jgi:predicted alpha/beta hydrolase family esterase
VRVVAEVLILHGWQNRRPDGHWQRWLAGELGASGAIVRYPQLPEPDEPVLDDWLRALDAELDGTVPDELTVVAHSV